MSRVSGAGGGGVCYCPTLKKELLDEKPGYTLHEDFMF